MALGQSPDKVRLTQLTHGVPYDPDGRPWFDIVRSPIDPALQLSGGALVVHREMLQVISFYNTDSAALNNWPPGTEEEGWDALPLQLRNMLFDKEPMALLTFSRVLLNAFNARRRAKDVNLYPWTETARTLHTSGRVQGGETAIARQLYYAGYYGGDEKTKRKVPTESLTALAVRPVPADAVDYLQLYPPALAPLPNEDSLGNIAKEKNAGFKNLTRRIKARKLSKVVRWTHSGEQELYKREDFGLKPKVA